MSSYCTLGFRPFLSYLVSLAGTIWPGGSVGQSAALSRRRSTVRIRSGSLAFGLIYGWIPEWPKGADCKSVVTDFGGSNPPPSIKTVVLNLHLGSQLSWESICLTSRGSQVRALQAPFISSRDRAVWQLVGLITRRSLVQIHLPQSDLEFSSKFFYAIIALFSLEGMLYNAI